MAEIAADVERALARRTEQGGQAGLDARIVARGEGWTVRDVVCTSGPQDRSYEERHSQVSLAIVAAGSFQYRARQLGEEPGDHDARFTAARQCGPVLRMRTRTWGGRPLSLVSIRPRTTSRGSPRTPAPAAPDRDSARCGCRRCATCRHSSRAPALRCWVGSDDVAWEELSIRLAVQAARLDSDLRDRLRQRVAGRRGASGPHRADDGAPS